MTKGLRRSCFAEKNAPSQFAFLVLPFPYGAHLISFALYSLAYMNQIDEENHYHGLAKGKVVQAMKNKQESEVTNERIIMTYHFFFLL